MRKRGATRRQRGFWIVDVVVGLVVISAVAGIFVPVLLSAGDMTIKANDALRLESLAASAAERLASDFPPCGASASEASECDGEEVLPTTEIEAGYETAAIARPVTPTSAEGRVSAPGELYLIEGVVRSPSGATERFSRIVGRP